jgi:HSP20 family molecular chaperone IbpA
MNAALGTDLLSPAAQGWTPLADVTETDDAYVVEIEIEVSGVAGSEAVEREPDLPNMITCALTGS